jgi:exopolyphosphatase / guanosine-5'-triphosphate,3'-diphosphate pyrophosphatase
MRIASIDIGTNTILLLVAEVNAKGISNVLCDQQIIARLGKGVDSDRMINRETFLRAESFLNDYRKTCKELQVDKIVAVGTSALRDAKNSNEFCRYIAERTGLDIEIISGDEEARWTYRGGISDFAEEGDHFCVIDIGGGSTEIITGTSDRILSKVSINIGSVRITERFLQDSPPVSGSLQSAKEFIRSELSAHSLQTTSSPLFIGVAGTVTTLAALDLQLPQFNAERINRHFLSRNAIEKIFDELKGKTIEQIIQYPQISSGRADILLAGIMILQGCMDAFGFDTIGVSVKGLRYGTLYREIENLPH